MNSYGDCEALKGKGGKVQRYPECFKWFCQLSFGENKCKGNNGTHKQCYVRPAIPCISTSMWILFKTLKHTKECF